MDIRPSGPPAPALISLILLAIGIIGVINRLPDTLTNYVKAQADKLSRAFRRR